MANSTISMAMFNSYVSLPEGISEKPRSKWCLYNLYGSQIDEVSPKR